MPRFAGNGTDVCACGAREAVAASGNVKRFPSVTVKYGGSAAGMPRFAGRVWGISKGGRACGADGKNLFFSRRRSPISPFGALSLRAFLSAKKEMRKKLLLKLTFLEVSASQEVKKSFTTNNREITNGRTRYGRKGYGFDEKTFLNK